MRTMSSPKLIALLEPDISSTTSTPVRSVSTSIAFFTSAASVVRTLKACRLSKLPAAALRAFAVDDVHLGRDVVADAESGTVGAFADLLDEAAELMAVNARGRHFVADRFIPMVDVLVGSADRRGGDADQHLIGGGCGARALANFRSFGPVFWRGFNDGQHRPSNLSQRFRHERPSQQTAHVTKRCVDELVDGTVLRVGFIRSGTVLEILNELGDLRDQRVGLANVQVLVQPAGDGVD